MKIEDEIKQKAFTSSFHKAMVNLIYTYNFLIDKQVQALKPYDITVQHYNILRILRGRHPKPASPGEIREVMLDKRGDLTRLLDKLDSMKLVNRQTCAENRRMVDVFITDSGIDFLRLLQPVMEKVHLQSHLISEQESEALSDILDKLRG